MPDHFDLQLFFSRYRKASALWKLGEDLNEALELAKEVAHANQGTETGNGAQDLTTKINEMQKNTV